MGATVKQRWKIISFHKSPAPSNTNPLSPPSYSSSSSSSVPIEFLCPLSATIMADPVIVSSGHTFERNCVHACLTLSFIPSLPDGSLADFSTLIPNLALRSTILNWCRRHHLDPPTPILPCAAHSIIRNNLLPHFTPTATPGPSQETSSDDGTLTPGIMAASAPPPSFYSSSSSCDIEIPSGNFVQEEEIIIAKLKSCQINDQHDALESLRKLTRTQEQSRARLCTPRLLSALRLLSASKHSSLQVNAVATLVNLSLEKQNKVKIVRSGIVPTLVDVLRGGSPEAQDHAAGALFSLSLDDQNKTAIGVLGALPPLLHGLRSESMGTRKDSALALYHLSLVQSNRVKMIKLGSVQILLGMVKSGWIAGRVMLILCNMAGSEEGMAAMLDGGAVECLVSYLGEAEWDDGNDDDEESAVTGESCLVALYGLSYGGLRFKGLAKEAGAEEILVKVEGRASERGKDKVRRILKTLRDTGKEEEEIDWEELLNSDSDADADADADQTTRSFNL